VAIIDPAVRARRFVKHQLARLGIDVSRRPRGLHPSLTAFDARRRRLLTDAGIDLALDVGANTGQFGFLLRRSGYTGRIVSFEPLSTAFDALSASAARDPAWDVVNAAAGASRGTATLHVSGNSWSSSTRPMSARHLRAAPESAYVSSETVRLTTLDDAVGEIVRPTTRLFLKIDVQGSELDVLDGGASTVAAASLLELEVSLVPLYEEAPSHLDVLQRVAKEGFVVVAIEEEFVEPSTARALQFNLIAAREGASTPPSALPLGDRGKL
jgi:FkbM family methyltransferase